MSTENTEALVESPETGEIVDENIEIPEENDVIILEKSIDEIVIKTDTSKSSIIEEDEPLNMEQPATAPTTPPEPCNHVESAEIPLHCNTISIKFSNEIMSSIYKRKFLRFLETFNDLIITHEDEININIKQVENTDDDDIVILDSDNDLLKLSSKSRNVKKRKKKKKIEKNKFILDTNPEYVSQDIHLIKSYISKFSLNKEVNSKNILTRSGVICFNCEGSHQLHDCPHRKDIYKIKANKEKFLSKNRLQRYHLNGENKYYQMEPGKISSNLRKALGIKDHQVPGYIYRMRKEGYPPGWLEEAKILESDLNLFDLDGNNVESTNKKELKCLDTDKLIRYPGFNVPLDEQFTDEYRRYSVEPYSKSLCIDNMIQFYNRLLQKDNLEAQDMDLDSSNDVICFSDLEVVSQVKLNEKSEDLDNDTLNDLKMKKDLLLQELKNAEETEPWNFDTTIETATPSSTSVTEITTDNIDESIPSEVNETIEIENESINMKETVIDSSHNDSCTSTTELNKTDNSIKETVFGTPILKSSSPYMDLPNPDKFSKGITPVINFDNLPNSIGKYEQLSDVLNKVRAQRNQVQNK